MAGGSRFDKLKRILAARRGKKKVSNPGALAAYIGREKYGPGPFAKMAAAGRRHMARASR